MYYVLQIIVIPVLIGLLFELLVVIPLRVPIDESPMFLLYQDWALGLVFLKIWTRLVSPLFLSLTISKENENEVKAETETRKKMKM